MTERDAEAVIGPRSPGGGLEAKAVSAVGWTAGGHALTQLLQFLSAVAFTRLLLPADFGLVGMSAVFVGLATLLAEGGLSAALIQRKEVEQRHLNTVFWVQVLVGASAALALAALSPLVGAFYDEPRAVPIFLVSSANFLLVGIGPVQRALLMRSLQSKPLVQAELLGFAVSLPVALGLALTGAGPWALVARGLLHNLVSSLGLVRAVRWQPTGGIERQAFLDLFRFSRDLMGFRVINYTIRNVDNALVGRYLGAIALGVYTRGYSILLLPSRHLTRVIGEIMFSSFSQLQGSPARVKRAYLKTISVVALVSMPTMAGLAVVAEEAVLVLFGPKWLPAVPLIRIFCATAVLESVAATTGWLFQSQGRTDLLLRWGLVAGGVPIVGIVAGVTVGTVEAVALGYGVGTLLIIYPQFAIPGKLIHMSVAEVARALSGILAAVGVLAAAAWLAGGLLPSDTAPALLLAVRGSVGIVVYGLLLTVFQPSPYRDLVRILSQRFARRKGG